VHWKHKASLQRFFSAIPAGESFNYVFQRFVTRSLPRDDAGFVFRAGLAQEILELVGHHAPRPISEMTFFEFGAGDDLIGPVTFYAMGVEKQIVVDRSTLARRSLVRGTLEKAARLGPGIGFVRLPKPGARPEDLGIDYRAPVEAASTGIDSGSVDAVTSNSTLEHVPQVELGRLLAECRRILRPGGMLCMRVDYEDHYGYTDRNVSPYNFLYYTDSEWEKYSPSMHYQNRLRHRDYVELFAEQGLEVLAERRLEAGPQTLVQLDTARLAPRFRRYEVDDLTVRKCTFLLRPRS
jgi:SAM-dependent methyltransferase